MLKDLLLRIHRSRIAKDTYRIFLFQLLALVFTLVSSVLVARTLGPEQKGQFDLYSLILSLITEFGLLGLPAGLLYFSMTKKNPLEKVHGTGIVMLLIAASLITLFLISISQFLLPFFPGLPSWVFYVALIVAPTSFYMVIWNNLMIAQNRAVTLQKMSAMFGGLNLIAILFLFSFGYLDFKGLLIISAILSLCIAAGSFWFLKGLSGHLEFDRNIARNSLKFGLPIFIGGIANYLHFKVDQLMISTWIGLEGVGLYALSVRWAEMLFLLDNAIMASALYKIGSSEMAESRLVSKNVMLVQFGVNLFGIVFLLLFALYGFKFLYGEAYAPSISPLLWLLPGVLFWSALKPMANHLTYKCNKGFIVGLVSIAGLLANIVLNYLLIKHYALGINGAAIASSCSYIAVALIVGTFTFMNKDKMDDSD